MTPVDGSQRRAARVVGLVYLVATAVTMSSEAFARAPVVVPDNGAATARNILQHERLFRLGIAGLFSIWRATSSSPLRCTPFSKGWTGMPRWSPRS